MYALKTNNLCKKYNEKEVLNNVNMTIEEGDIYGFVGENGAGKTTLIRVICGLISPTSGSYSIYEKDFKDKDFIHSKNKIGGIVENVSLFGSMSALDNLRYQNLFTGAKKTDKQLIDLLYEVGLLYNDIRDKKVKNFSLGMRQRLGIAIIMVSDPKFIVLDEPLNGVDPQGMIDIRNTILHLNEKGVTFLISSHLLSELDKICNKVGIISGGKILAELDLEEMHQLVRKHILIKCANQEDNEKVKSILENVLQIKDVKIANGAVQVYDNIDMNVILKELVNNNINVINITCRDESIEDFYTKLVGRGR